MEQNIEQQLLQFTKKYNIFFDKTKEIFPYEAVETVIKSRMSTIRPIISGIYSSAAITPGLPILNIEWLPELQEVCLDNIMLSTSMRRKGISRRIIFLVEELATNLDATTLSITTLTNKKFKDNLLKLGFRTSNRSDSIHKVLN